MRILKKTLFFFVGIFFLSVVSAETTILFLGDSLTEGYGLDERYAYPSVIKEKLQEDNYAVTIINGGISGSTSASGYQRLKWFAKRKIDILVLALGANDGLRGLSTEAMENNLSQTVKLAQKNNMKVILAGMMIPPNYGSEYIQDFRDVFPSIAKKYKTVLIPFLLKNVAAQRHLNLPDGIHPNIDGQKIVADNVYEYLIPILP